MNEILNIRNEIEDLQIIQEKTTKSRLAGYRKETLVQRKNRLDIEIFKKYRGTIQQGFFKGVRLSVNPLANRINKETSIGNNYASKIFGFYESEVLNYINKMNYDVFLNIGCADGYYLSGMLKNNLCKVAFGFEKDIKMRRLALKTMKLNKIKNARYRIFTKASEVNFRQLLEGDSDDRFANWTLDAAGGGR